MAFKKRIIAVFTVSRKVAVFIQDMQALMLALTTAPGNTYLTLAPALVTAINARIATLVAGEAEAAKRTEGAAATRDIALAAVVNDASMLKAEVQLAANAGADVDVAKQIIQGCGMKVKTTSPRTKPDFTVTNVANTQGMLRFSSKAADKGKVASYVFQTSNNGINFTTVVVSTKSAVNWVSGAAPGTKLYCRKQVITNKDTGVPPYSQTVIVLVS